MFDVKKITSSPNDEFEAVQALVKREQELITALHIMKSVVDNPADEFKEFHTKRINDFLAKFKS